MLHARNGLILGLGFELLFTAICAGQVLETETARLRPAGGFTLGGNYEWQTSSEGRERAVPLVLEYGLTARSELLVEPVISTAILPKAGRRAYGLGDLEVTATYLVRSETPGLPAVALAGEVKFPTARDELIGTGKADYTGYVIASKWLGHADLHGNLGYTVIGQLAGTHLSNIISGALAGEYPLSDRAELFCEVLGNTASTPEGEGKVPEGQGTVPPEATGGELVGTLGAGVRPIRSVLLSLSFSYDNNNAFLIRPGLTWVFR